MEMGQVIKVKAVWDINTKHLTFYALQPKNI